MAIRSTLSEVNVKLAEVLFTILNSLDPIRWCDSGQVIYSTVDDWNTAQEAYKVYNKVREVKYPFASLTRTPVEMDNHKPWSDNFIVNTSKDSENITTDNVRIKPVRVRYDFIIYEDRLEDIEAFSDLIIIDGRQTQRLDFNSQVINQPARLSFFMEEPVHGMIADRDEKRDARGFIYSLKIPITVDTVLGLRGAQNVITGIIYNTFT